MDEQPVAFAMINAVAEQLREQFDVRRLAATGASAGKFEERLPHLHLAHAAVLDFGRRSRSGIERKKSQFVRSLSRNGNCGRMLIAFSRASDLLRAGQTSTQMPQPVQSSTAICSVYCSPFHSGSRASRVLKVAWRTFEHRSLVNFAANDGMWTNQHAFAALDAHFRFPNRHFAREIALLELSRAGRKSAIVRQCADRDTIAAAGHDFAEDLAHEFGGVIESPLPLDATGVFGISTSYRCASV